MHFTCRSFAGKQEEGAWSQFWENEPDDPSVYLRKGHLFGLVSTSSPILGRQLIELINQHYFSSSQDNIFQSLTESVRLLTSDSRFQDLDFSLSLVVASNQQLYLLQHHLGSIVLRRQNQISLLLQGVDRKVLSLTGRFNNHDWLFLTSGNFCQNFTWEKTKDFFTHPDLSDFEENLHLELYSSSHSAAVAAAIIQFNVDDQDVLPSSLPPVRLRRPSLKSRLTRLFRHHPVDSIYVSPRQLLAVSRRRRFYLVFSIILISLLSVLFYFGYRKSHSLQVEKKFQELKLQIDQKLNDALAIKNLNLDSAQQLANQARGHLRQLEAINVHRDEIDNYRRQIDQLLSQTGAADSWQPNMFYDTSLITNTPHYSRLTLSGRGLYLLDSEVGRLDLLNVDNKSIKNLIAHPDLKSYTALFTDSSQLYVYNDRQISLVDSGRVNSKVSASDLLAVRPWNHALYALTASSSAIVKYTPTSTGFDSGKNWLSTPLGFTPVSMAINGRVWLLSGSGQIVPFTRGTKDSFATQSTPKFEHPDRLSVSLDDNYLAFVDADRLVYVYKKDGSTLARYNFGDRKILDITLSDSSPDLFVLCADQKIYKITL